MSIVLGQSQYGKAETRVVRIYRDTERHEIRDLNVTTALRGDFDAAHLAGCMCAIALCVLMLPFRPGPIVVAGLAFTLVTYFVQSVIRGSLETWEGDQQ